MFNRLSGAVARIASWFRSWRVSSGRYRGAMRQARSYASQYRRQARQSEDWQREAERLRDTVSEQEEMIAKLTSQKEVLEGQIELLVAVVQRELERVQTETAILTARRVRASMPSVSESSEDSL